MQHYMHVDKRHEYYYNWMVSTEEEDAILFFILGRQLLQIGKISSYEIRCMAANYVLTHRMSKSLLPLFQPFYFNFSLYIVYLWFVYRIISSGGLGGEYEIAWFLKRPYDINNVRGQWTLYPDYQKFLAVFANHIISDTS